MRPGPGLNHEFLVETNEGSARFKLEEPAYAGEGWRVDGFDALMGLFDDEGKVEQVIAHARRRVLQK
jgi:hypothetical protein